MEWCKTAWGFITAFLVVSSDINIPLSFLFIFFHKTDFYLKYGFLIFQLYFKESYSI